MLTRWVAEVVVVLAGVHRQRGFLSAGGGGLTLKQGGTVMSGSWREGGSERGGEARAAARSEPGEAAN